VELEFCGAARTVTRSKYLLRSGRAQILIDCGLYQGAKSLRERNWSPPPFDVAALDAVVLTHAHLDHTGYLPLLVKRGFRGRVHCTEATAALCGILLRDSGRLQEEEAEHANRKHWSRHSPALPLYTEADAENALARLVAHPFDADIDLGHGLHFRFVPAGHILGSASVLVSDARMRILFSGDVGRPNDPLMRPPAPLPEVDYLVVESTYGDRRHDPADPHLQMGDVIKRAAHRGGVIVLPTFAVGRAQSLLWCIHRLKRDGLVPDSVPVFLNSPMAIDVTAVYHRHRIEHRLTYEQCEGMCHVARYVNTVDESKALNTRRGPMVILAGSGMATGGRVVHHLKTFAPDPRSTIAFAGFQAEGTRGAALLGGAKTIRIHGEDVRVRASVVALDNLSAHADCDEMVAWLRTAPRPPRTIFVTHGEPAAADALRRRIHEMLAWSCEVPEYRQRASLQ
jgi:metallo-beta-lactamase family protein